MIFIVSFITIVHNNDSPLTCLRYIRSHESAKLNQEPNFDYLGQPLNSYHLIKHVALGWEEIREKVFKVENKTREAFGKRVTEAFETLGTILTPFQTA